MHPDDGVELLNYVDAEGLPICPTCGRSIRPFDSVARPDGCMVHALCYVEALKQPDPCEPTPS